MKYVYRAMIIIGLIIMAACAVRPSLPGEYCCCDNHHDHRHKH